MVKYALLVIFEMLFSLVVYAQGDGMNCKGIFRWDVKTLTDPGGIELLSANPSDSMVSQLVSVFPPKHFFVLSKKDGMLPRYREEKQVVKVVAFIVKVNTQHDMDLHIVIKSPDADVTMIAEIPDPGCRIFDSIPSLRKVYTEARHQLKKVTDEMAETNMPVLVEITGVPFWDARHWWIRGCARNGREIHPVLSVKTLSR
jgi:hypothetical protein